MGQISDHFESAYRDFTLDGVPSSGLYEPVKSDLRTLGDTIESGVDDLVKPYAVQASNALNAVLAAVAAGTLQSYGSTAQALATGVAGLSYVPGSGASVSGTFPVTFSGGGGSGAVASVAVSGGSIVGYAIQTRGSGYTSTPGAAVTVTGLTGASVTAITGPNTVSGQFFSIPNAATGAIDIYQNVSGTPAYQFSLYSGPTPLAKETGYLFAIMDAAGKGALMIGLDGTVYPQKIVLPAQSVTAGNLASALAALMPTAMLSDETGYVWAVVDAAQNIGLALTKSGQLLAPGLQVPVGSIGFQQLSSGLSPYIATNLSPESGYVWGVVDAAGKIGLGIKTDGSVVGSIQGLIGPGSVGTANIAAQAITEPLLAPILDRQMVPHATDVIEVEPDRWRGTASDVGLLTQADGTGWEQFPRALTNMLRGINQSGTAINFRKSSRLTIRGRRYQSAGFNPGSTAATTYKGVFGDGTNSPIFPASSGVAGDYYVCAYPTVVISSTTYHFGDLVIWNGTAWVYQACPGSYNGLPTEGDWWYATAAGTFAGITLALGDVIYCVTNHGMGGPGIPVWGKGQYAINGELFYRGQFAPSGALPSSPANGEVYQASAAGTAGAFTLALGDYLVYEQGQWAQVPTNPIQTVAAGAAVYLPCGGNANEWEARRADLGATRVGVVLKGRTQTVRRRNSDTVMLFSDSMFGVNDIGGKIAALLAPRSVAQYSTWGGSSSRQIQGAVENAILNSGDPYAGNVLGIWHGQNNQPAAINDANSAQIKQVAREIAALCGARDKRFFFLSILGQNIMTFNGTRIVCPQFETDFAAGGRLLDIEQFYAAAFPGQWLSPRLAQIAGAGSTLDVRVPGTGMTEAQTAASYGWVPMSFFNPPSGLTTALSAMSLKGYWTSSSLPTGGASGDCYTRSSGTPTITSNAGGVGNLLVNQGGTWGEYQIDQTHQGPLGATNLAAAVAAFINSNLW